MAETIATNMTDRVAQQVDQVYEQIARRLETPDVPVAEVRDFVLTLLEATRGSLEELRVADEEIRTQHEAIVQAQDELEAQRLHYHDLFQAAPVGYVVTNFDGVIIEANLSAARMLGTKDAHLTGKPLVVFIPSEYRIAFRDNLATMIATGHVAHWETQYTPRNGIPRHAEVTAVPVESDDQMRTAPHVRWLLHDITDKRKYDEIRLEHFFRETFEQAAIGIGHLGFNGRWLRVNPALSTLVGYERDELLSMRIHDLCHPDDAARLEEAHRQIVDGARPVVSLELRCLSKRSGIVWLELTISSVSDAHGHHAYGIVVAGNITESKRLIAAERRQRLLTEALRDTAMTLTSTLDFEEVLDQIVVIMSGIFSQKAAAIMLAENTANGSEFRIVRAWGYSEHVVPWLEQALKSIRTPAAPDGIFERLTTAKQPVIVYDWSNHGEWESATEIRLVRSVIAVPIMAYDEVIGCLQLHSALPSGFTAQQGELLETFAAHAAVAIQNARAHQQAQQLAAHEERQRLARELHDAVTQSLFSASIIAESLVRRKKDDSDQTLSHLQELHLLARGALAEMRTLLIELRPEYLLKSPLPTQIRQLTDAARSRKKMDIEFTVNGGGTLLPEVQIAFYRIAQEVFNNIVKHSQAQRADVTLTIEPHLVTLDIADDGIGFDSGNDSLTGIGLTTMRERAAAIGAALSVTSKQQHGTRVMCAWPK